MTSDAGVLRRPFSESLHRFRDEVGESGAIAVAGGRTAWDLGGPLVEGTRCIAAPASIVRIDPAEMTVRVGAGLTVAELDAALADTGQEVALPLQPGSTVGGVLAVGRSSPRRPRLGPVRDTLLEAEVVGADGRLVRCGGPTVKNVTGYDLCRLLVGSLGTLALLGEVLLRTRPRAAMSRWTAGDVDPALLGRLLLRPACHLWDGERRWFLHEGHPGDVDAAVARLLAEGAVEVSGPPDLPPHRWSVDPSDLAALAGDGCGAFVAEVGIGTVHRSVVQPRRSVSPAVRTLHDRMRALFDPTQRLNPGRDPLDR